MKNADLSDTIADYTFDLPESQIAQRPIEGPRHDAKLLLVRRHPSGGLPQFEDLQVSDLPSLIAENVELQGPWVRNRSRVLPARFYVHRNGSSEHEVLLLEEESPGIWRALIRRQARFHYPQKLTLRENPSCVLESPSPGLIDLRNIGQALEKFLQQYGEMPLPPYIKTRVRGDDFKNYQNPFALHEKLGSVAAPTASLHFTPELLERMFAQGCRFEDLILHVGLGTFEPVRVEKLSEHHLHAERLEVSAQTFKNLEAHDNGEPSFVCVGTTAMRSLESLGLNGAPMPPSSHLIRQEDSSFIGKTSLFVRPGFPIRYTRALFTNFHLPESTLLVLVASFAGSRHLALEAYKHAVKRGYRFYSYGDASLWV